MPRKSPQTARKPIIGRGSGQGKAKPPKPVKTDRGDIFPLFCKTQGLPIPECEYPFAQSKGRRFRFDYAFPAQSVALEVDGGIWTRGRHTRGKGWLADTEKLNLACVMGWRMLRCTPQQLFTPEMIETIREALEAA